MGDLSVTGSAASSTPTTFSYISLMNDVSYFLYGKADYTDLTATQETLVGKIVNLGYRQFLYPQAVEGLPDGFEWSFLRPVTTLATVADDEDQNMPSDFGRLISDGFVFEADAQVPYVLADVGEGKIRKLRQQSDQTGRPRLAAIRTKSSDGSAAQLKEVMWYPKPDDAYTLSYRYEALASDLTVANPYLLGSTKHSEVLRLSCLSAADATAIDKPRGIHWEDFQRSVVAAAKRDQREGPRFFGNVGCRGEYDEKSSGGISNYTLTVSGVVIET